MMKYSVAVLLICVLLHLGNCRPSAPVEEAITKDMTIDLPASERISKRSITKEMTMILPANEKINKRSITRDTSVNLPAGERISKRSITKDIPIDLPAGERISKRAITRDIPVDLPSNERINKRSVDDYADTSSEDYWEGSGEFITSENDRTSIKESEPVESNEDIVIGESNIVFRPLFVYRRRIANKNASYGTPTNTIRSRRSVELKEEQNEEYMNAEEAGLVFRPLFRSRGTIDEKRRVRRSADKLETKLSSRTDDLEPAEDLVFRPLFRQRNRQIRDLEGNGKRNGDFTDDVMDVAENGLVFRPLFRTKQRDSVLN